MRSGDSRVREARRLRWVVAVVVAVALAACVPGLDLSNGDKRNDDREGSERFRGRGVTVPSGQVLTPAGTHIEFQGRAVAVEVRPDGKTAALLTGTNIQAGFGPFVTVVDVHRGTVVQQFSPPSAVGSYAGLVYTHDGTHLYASMPDGVTEMSVGADGKLTLVRKLLPGEFASGLAVTDDDATLLVALNKSNELALVNRASGATVARIPVGNAPHGVLVHGTSVFVSNQGGRRARPGDLTNLSSGTPIVVDAERGSASTGTVSVIDLGSRKVAREISVGLHPTALAERDGIVFVANTNSDSISAIDTRRSDHVSTFPLDVGHVDAQGSAPNGLAFLGDGRLLVTIGRDNALAVYDWDAHDGRAEFEGLLPTGWYPADVSVARDGRTVVVANAAGAGTTGPVGPSIDEIVQSGFYPDTKVGHHSRAWVASASILRNLTHAALRSGLRQVASNNGWLQLRDRAARPHARPVAIPERDGEPSTITHVVYIIKENRTYDQILGDDTRGNGDPSLVQFGQDVTPNQHELARRWSLFDNFYSPGAVSADGHQWVTQADNPDYLEKMFNTFPAGRSYPSDGGDALAYLQTGFLWESAQQHGKSVRVYGEYAKEHVAPTHSDVPSLDRILNREYPPFDLTVSDQDKAKIFFKDLRQWESTGNAPNLVMLLLPNDHTQGSNPGFPTPQTQVADNDIALGQIISALSTSRFWPHTAVFVVEDDAQGGVDHIDGHRTTAFVASPYAARGTVIHKFFNQVNMVRTIGRILGLPPLNRMDEAATPMYEAFTDHADPRPYVTLRPSVLPAVNPAASQVSGVQREWAVASAQMDFSSPDVEANRPLLNRVIWYTAKGFDTPYPGDGRVLHPEEVRRLTT